MTTQLLEIVREFDRWLLLTINGCHTDFLDRFFELITGKLIWLPLYLMLAYHLYKRFTKGFYLLLVCALGAVLFSDQLASSVIKPLFHRLRPCHVNELATQLHLVNGYCGGAYGFVSSHAANTFSLALFVFCLYGQRFTRLTTVLFVWAFMVSLSRVYLGVHYPLDIIAGAMLGSILGVGAAAVYLNRYPYLKQSH